MYRTKLQPTSYHFHVIKDLMKMTFQTYSFLFPAPVPGDARSQDGRNSVPRRGVLLQVGWSNTVCSRDMARFRGSRC